MLESFLFLLQRGTTSRRQGFLCTRILSKVKCFLWIDSCLWRICKSQINNQHGLRPLMECSWYIYAWYYIKWWNTIMNPSRSCYLSSRVLLCSCRFESWDNLGPIILLVAIYIHYGRSLVRFTLYMEWWGTWSLRWSISQASFYTNSSWYLSYARHHGWYQNLCPSTFRFQKCWESATSAWLFCLIVSIMLKRDSRIQS